MKPTEEIKNEEKDKSTEEQEPAKSEDSAENKSAQ